MDRWDKGSRRRVPRRQAPLTVRSPTPVWVKPLVIADQTMDLDQALPKRTLEAIDNLPNNSLDTIDRDYRRTLWHQREERHWENVDTDDDPGFGLMLVSGDKGAGKTTLISLLAGDLYDRGFSVGSNISLLFGHQTRDVRDIFTFLKTFPEKTCFALDEVHALLSVYRQATSRPAEFLSQLAGLRKRRITIIAGTSQERSVDHGFRGEVDWRYYPTPRRYRPAGKRARRKKRATGGFAQLPAWAHITVYAIGPKPWGSGSTLGEEYGLPIRRGKPKSRRIRGLTPLNFYQAAGLQYTFEDIPLGTEAGTELHVRRHAGRDAECGNDRPGGCACAGRGWRPGGCGHRPVRGADGQPTPPSLRRYGNP